MYYESEQTIRDLVAIYNTTYSPEALKELHSFLRAAGDYVIYAHSSEFGISEIDSIVLDAVIDSNGYWYCIEF